MTQPEHPFTDLPEGAEVKQITDSIWHIETNENCIEVRLWSYTENSWGAYLKESNFLGPTTVRSTPNEAFQALRQAVRELANDLGVV